MADLGYGSQIFASLSQLLKKIKNKKKIASCLEITFLYFLNEGIMIFEGIKAKITDWFSAIETALNPRVKNILHNFT